MMQLSKYFTLKEMIVSDYAKRHKIDNTPDAKTLAKLTTTAKKLDDVRELLNTPIIVTSGYRCLKVNRGIGSSDTSQHVKGEAVDFKSIAYTPRQIWAMIKLSNIDYDQLILEYDDWVHISFKDGKNRKQAFEIG
jgi:hypothetical protein